MFDSGTLGGPGSAASITPWSLPRAKIVDLNNVADRRLPGVGAHLETDNPGMRCNVTFEKRLPAAVCLNGPFNRRR
jgi:hypothetical protein